MSRTRIAAFALALACATASAFAQTVPPQAPAPAAAPDPHEAQPERPTVATHAGTVATGWLELEAGAEFDRYADHTHGAGAPIVAKIGIASHAQLSVFGSVVRPAGTTLTGVGDLAVGVKWRLADHAPVLGRFAILPSIKLPTGSSDSGTGTGTTDVSMLFISSHDLGPVALDLNVGYTRRNGTGENAPRSATVWTISFGAPAAGRLGWTAELYGYPRTTGPAGADRIVAVLAGPTVQARPWLVFDIGVIVPVTGPQPHALYFGGVYNVGQLWK